jgi:hypothetical protein
MYFSNEDLVKLKKEFKALDGKFRQMYEGYLWRTYVSERGREFGQQGFVRRLQTMKRCIDRVYDILPPELEDVPNNDVRHDAEMFVQAFVFHTFGAADNLAWIWVHEKNIRRADGSPIPDGSVGIRKAAVQRSFSERFRNLLDARADWFAYLENSRHSLAHRIPLYIPPYIVTHANEAAYRDFDVRMAETVARLDFDERERLKTEQKKLTLFRPWMQHSFVEAARPMVFHFQMIADFNTIHEMAVMLMEDLVQP